MRAMVTNEWTSIIIHRLVVKLNTGENCVEEQPTEIASISVYAKINNSISIPTSVVDFLTGMLARGFAKYDYPCPMF
jgi:hypothetical protein